MLYTQSYSYIILIKHVWYTRCVCIVSYYLPYRIGIVSRALSTILFHVILFFIAVFSSSVVSPISSHSCFILYRIHLYNTPLCHLLLLSVVYSKYIIIKLSSYYYYYLIIFLPHERRALHDPILVPNKPIIIIIIIFIYVLYTYIAYTRPYSYIIRIIYVAYTCMVYV